MPTVFISSTVDDLRPFRAAAKDGAISARVLPDMQDYFAARDNPPLNVCLERIAHADVLVLIVAHRYGWVPPDQPGGVVKSIIWLEAEHAASLDKEVLAFVVDDAASWDEKAKEGYELLQALDEDRAVEQAATVQRNVKQLKRFKEWVKTRAIRATFTNPEDLRHKVDIALREWLARHPEFGLAGPPPTPSEPDTRRYLEACREETAWIEIRGLQAAEGRAHRFPIADLYIPLVNEAATAAEPSAESRAVFAEVPDRKPAPLEQAFESRCLVVVGDPGAGKSTFLRCIANRVCAALLKSGAPDDTLLTLLAKGSANAQVPFPILVRVADLSSLPPGRTDSLAPLTALLAKCGLDYGLPEPWVRKRIEDGPCLLLLDGLDEAPSEALRETFARLVERAARAWTNTRFVVTTRPQAYRGDAILTSFEEARIGPLESDSMRVFLARWSAALYPESASKAVAHSDELIHAIESKPEIWRMARNPVMLTAVAVLHWNEKRMPEQRADLYESILGWLSKSRKRGEGRPTPERCLALLQELAWAMQVHPGGRLVQAGRDWAVEILAPRFREEASPEARLERARTFLEDEENDSGIVVRRGTDVRFWHLTFQEHLAARALAAMNDHKERNRILFKEGNAYSAEWREVVLLLAGLLHRSRPENADALVSAALDFLYRGSGWRVLWQAIGTEPRAEQRARCAILLGAILRDLQPLSYHPSDPRCEKVVRSVMDIFDAERSLSMPFQERLELAEAIGQAGDPRLQPGNREANWVTVPGGNFQIGRYPVTVQEYRRFVDDGGYKVKSFWKEGGFTARTEPGNWDEQLLHPNRPLVEVTWYEAAAYCAWSGARLPTDEEWQLTARGTKSRRYPWGNESPDPIRANYRETDLRAPTPVGLFPLGATPEGIQDLAGNVWEWTSGHSFDRRFVLGGSWRHHREFLSWERFTAFDPGSRDVFLGFRCARQIP